MINESDKNVRQIIPFKKFGRIRVNIRHKEKVILTKAITKPKTAKDDYKLLYPEQNSSHKLLKCTLCTTIS